VPIRACVKVNGIRRREGNSEKRTSARARCCRRPAEAKTKRRGKERDEKRGGVRYASNEGMNGKGGGWSEMEINQVSEREDKYTGEKNKSESEIEREGGGGGEETRKHVAVKGGERGTGTRALFEA